MAMPAFPISNFGHALLAKFSNSAWLIVSEAPVGSSVACGPLLRLLQLIGSVLDVKFVRVLSVDTKEGHHAAIE